VPSFNIEAALTEKVQSDDDDFLLGYHGGHSDEELKAMSFVHLCSQLELATPGTTRYMLLETEKRRCDSVQILEQTKTKPDHTRKEAAEPSSNKHEPKRRWPEEPVGIIGLGVVIIVIGALVTHLLKSHFGLNP